MNGVVIPTPPEGARDGVAGSRARRVELAITGMTGAACAGRIERALLRCERVLSVSVDLAAGQARVSLSSDPAETDAALAARLQTAVEAAGFTATMRGPDPATGSSHPSWADRREWLDPLLACVLTAPLLLAMLLHLAFSLTHQGPLAARVLLPGWVQFLLATPVQFWLGRRFYGAGSTNHLLALGSTAAWGLSTVELLHGSPLLYFGDSALIITYALLGGWLERRARHRALAGVRTLAALCPERVLRIDQATGAEQEVALATLRADDLLVVPAGVRIAADGIVRDGESQVDESRVTGESRAIRKARGEPVIAGALVVDGRLVIEVRAVGARTRLAAMLLTAEAPLAATAAIRPLVDRVSFIVVPVALGIALLAFIGWYAATGHAARALLEAVSVLVIACPCAVGLAMPAVLAAGAAAAARAGILTRGIRAFERGGGIGLMVFDKTTTLTDGRPVLERMVPAGGAAHYAEAAELLSLAAAMQAGSLHPLAAAVHAASGHAVSQAAERFAQLPGRGVSARVGGRSLLLGSRRMIEGDGMSLPAALAEAAEQVEADGGTVSLLAERRAAAAGGKRILGLFGFADTVRPGAVEAARLLSRRGIMTVLLTGDGEAAGRRVADMAGIDRLLTGLSPEEKAGAVETLIRERRGIARPGVAMVGHGISDAAALAASDLAIATIGAGDGAIAPASLVLLRDDPILLAEAVAFAGRASSRLREALFWVFVPNLVGIVLAAAGLLSPALAAGAMVLGVAGVLVTALRLRGWQPDRDPTP